MPDPIVDPADLGAYLNDEDSINEVRAELLIQFAQTRCETYVGGQLPTQAAGVVCRVAARGYISITSARQYQLEMADSQYGTSEGPGGIYLMPEDKGELDDIMELYSDGPRIEHEHDAFTIRMTRLPDPSNVGYPW